MIPLLQHRPKQNKQGLDVVRPMILSDFEPCFQVSAHAYRYNPSLSYSIIRRGENAALPASASASATPQGEGRVLSEGPWEVFAHDSRLPESGWAFLESRVRWGAWSDVVVQKSNTCRPLISYTYTIPPPISPQEEEPFRLEVESKYFDSCFYIKKPSSAPTENPFREADYADYSDKGLAH